MGAEYVGQAFVTEPDGDEVEVRASLRGDDDWGGYLIGPADWIGIASSTEPFFEIRLPDGREGLSCWFPPKTQAELTSDYPVDVAVSGGSLRPTSC